MYKRCDSASSRRKWKLHLHPFSIEYALSMFREESCTDHITPTVLQADNQFIVIIIQVHNGDNNLKQKLQFI